MPCRFVKACLIYNRLSREIYPKRTIELADPFTHDRHVALLDCSQDQLGAGSPLITVAHFLLTAAKKGPARRNPRGIWKVSC